MDTMFTQKYPDEVIMYTSDKSPLVSFTRRGHSTRYNAQQYSPKGKWFVVKTPVGSGAIVTLHENLAKDEALRLAEETAYNA